ncbi:MAG: two-component regulator propeller domain-containing protein [Bacteroidota bacterium]|nr:two-component regulator propeller domain-containing protein [Bacteroidota bacterium]
MKLVKAPLLALLFFLLHGIIPAQPAIHENIEDPLMEFRHFTVEEGLSKNNISSLYQDRFGYLWIGTSDGLNRYNGKSFKNYYHDPDDSTSILSNNIMCFAEDNHNKLWIGTDLGLVRYIRERDQFEEFKVPGMDSVFPGNYIRAIYFDNDSIMYLGFTEGYFVKYDMALNVASWHQHSRDDQPYYYYYTICEDGNGDIWYGGRSTGLFRYLKEKDSSIRIRTMVSDSGSRKRENDVSCYLEDSHGNFWVSGLDGIYLYDREKDAFSKFYATSTWQMAEDMDGNIWFATGHGIMTFDPNSGTLIKHAYNPDNPKSISNNNVRKLLIDHQGNIWFGTMDGLDLLIRPEYPFEIFRHVINIDSTLSSNKVTSVLEDSKDRIWIGTDGGGLNIFDLRNRVFKSYRHEPDKHASIGSNRISALYEDNAGTLWIGLWAGTGFDRYEESSDRFVHYTYNPNSLSQDWYNDFAEDEFGNFYLGFWGGPGLTIFDRENEHFGEELLHYFDHPYKSRLINKMLFDRHGKLWMATSSNGLNVYDPESRETWNFLPDDADERSLPVIEINCLFEDKDGNIWLGGKGLSRYVPASNDFDNYFITDGLSNDNVKSILQDEQGMLWIGTEDGLSRFDPAKKVFKNFYEYDGLSSNWFGKGACRLRNGKMIFGGNKGISVFHPDSIIDRSELPPLYISKFKIFDRDSLFDLSGISRIDLDYEQDFFSFDVGAIDFVNPGRLKLEYKLEGFDKDWNILNESSREIRFTNVPPGKYLLKLRVSKAGLPGFRTKYLHINIQPPFWQRWWFYIIEAVVIAGILLLLYWLRIRQILAKKHTAELKQKLLRSQMNPHFIFNSLTAIQDYIYEKEPAEAGKYLSGFARLMRQILSNSREEYISLDNEINYLVLYMDLQQLRFENKFEYKLHVDPDLEQEFTAIPPMLAQPFIENALEHGISNSDQSGRIIIRFDKKEDHVRFTLEDNGIGIEHSREIKTKGSNHKSLAIQITRERLENLNRREKNKIELSVVDISREETGKTGTRVTFSIPFRDF